MTTATAPSNTFLQRLIGAAALDSAIYEEVEADHGATGQALVVVVLSSLAAGFGARGLRRHQPANIAFFSIVALMAWAAWALLDVSRSARGCCRSRRRVDVGELLRTIGFSATPGLLRVFGVMPGRRRFRRSSITAIWMLLAMVVAVRQALDYTSTRRAVAVCVVGLGAGRHDRPRHRPRPRADASPERPAACHLI